MFLLVVKNNHVRDWVSFGWGKTIETARHYHALPETPALHRAKPRFGPGPQNQQKILLERDWSTRAIKFVERAQTNNIPNNTPSVEMKCGP